MAQDTRPSRRPSERPPLLARGRPTPLVGASLLAADHGRLADEARQVLDAGADLLHIDVMDGRFVPNLAFGTDVCRMLRRETPEAVLDVHLMVADPAPIADLFADAGADHVTVHAESTTPDLLAAIAGRLRARGLTAGLAIKPATPLAPLAELLDRFDLLLVMSVEPGFAGQAFLPGTPDRVREARAAFGPDLRIEVDGGVGPAVSAPLRSAGADVLVSASAIFREPPAARGACIEAMRGPN